MNEQYQAMKAAQDYIQELEDQLSVARDAMQDYIGLANLVNCFVDITPEHPMYDSIQEDIITYLERIRGENTNSK